MSSAGDGHQRDERELADEIARRLPALERHVRRRMGRELRQKESASDIVQSTARELLRAPRFEDRGAGGLERWLRAAAEHKIQNRLRYWRTLARSGDEELVEPGAAPTEGGRPSQDAMLREETARLHRAIERLPDEYARVVRRIRLDGASYEMVADELGKTPDAVRKLLARALGRLSTLVRE